jgi:hypothetical protein
MFRRSRALRIILLMSVMLMLTRGTPSGPLATAAGEGVKNARYKSDGGAVVPFSMSERLRYRGYWMGIPVGWAELSVSYEEDEEGRPILHFRSKAWSTGIFGRIYPVEDQVDSYFDLNNLRPLRYRIKQSEGNHKHDKRIDFDHSSGKATYSKDQEPPRVFDVTPGIQDPLSSLYYLRMQKMEVGKPVEVKSFVRRQNAVIEVEVLRISVIETGFGILDTYLVSPSSQYEGIFKKSGRIKVWLSADELKIPIRIESRIAVGAIMGVLKEVDEETAKVFPRPR